MDWRSYNNRPRCCPPRNRGDCWNCHEGSQLTSKYIQPFINASCCLNSDLGQLGDDSEPYRRCKAGMNNLRRENKSSRSNPKNPTSTIDAAVVTCGDNTGAKVSPPHKMTVLAHTRRTVPRRLGLATTVELSPHPPLPLWPPPLASVIVSLTTPA